MFVVSENLYFVFQFPNRSLGVFRVRLRLALLLARWRRDTVQVSSRLFARFQGISNEASLSSLTYCLSPALRPTSESRPAESPPPRLRDENCLELTFSPRCSLHGDHA
jgi:hypothetical protein